MNLASAQTESLPRSSSSASQDIHCRPEPSRPPAPNRKGITIRGSAPPFLSRTIPIRRTTARAPNSEARRRRHFPLARVRVGEEIRAGRTRLGELFVAAITVEADGRSADKNARRSRQFLRRSRSEMWSPRRGCRAAVACAQSVQRPSAMDAPARCTTASAPSALRSSVPAPGSQAHGLLALGLPRLVGGESRVAGRTSPATSWPCCRRHLASAEPTMPVEPEMSTLHR